MGLKIQSPPGEPRVEEIQWTAMLNAVGVFNILNKTSEFYYFDCFKKKRLNTHKFIFIS